MSDYRNALAQEAFGHVPLFQESDRDEDRWPLELRADRVYYHMQRKRWEIWFRGATRFETFPPEQYDQANTLFKSLQAGPEEVPCSVCDGAGTVEDMRPKCCGNLTPGGDCRAHCAVPEEFREVCTKCHGTGRAG